MFAPQRVPRPASRPIGGAWLGALALAALVAGPAGTASADAQSRKVDKVQPADPGKPAFFVDWSVSKSPPGLTARPARAKSDSLPVYPAESARRREAGTTALTLCVTTDGRLTDVKLARSSGYPRLDEATMEWARSARFTPALINGDPVNICGYSLEYTWKLEG
jgi:protein TonB